MQALPSTMSQGSADVTRVWLDSAQETGVEDGYRGKRSDPRYSWDAPVTVEALDSRSAGRPAYAYATNISAGGMGLRCRERVDVFQRLRVTLDETGESVCGRVRHCSAVANGYLVGIQFEAELVEPAELRKSA